MSTMKSIAICLTELGLSADRADALKVVDADVKKEVLEGIGNHVLSGCRYADFDGMIAEFTAGLLGPRTLPAKTQTTVLQLAAALEVLSPETLAASIVNRSRSHAEARSAFRRVFPNTPFPTDAEVMRFTSVEFVAMPESELGSFGFRAYVERNRGNLSTLTGVLKIGEYVIAEVFDKGEVQVRAGRGAREMRHLFAGNPTPSFWTFWKREKAAMQAAGLSIQKNGGEWEVVWWQQPVRASEVA